MEEMATAMLRGLPDIDAEAEAEARAEEESRNFDLHLVDLPSLRKPLVKRRVSRKKRKTSVGGLRRKAIENSVMFDGVTRWE
jgi:hypothetical protein